MTDVRLIEIDAGNWRQVAAVRPQPDQERFVAPISYYLCLAHYGGEWHPLAVEASGSIVGHLMWAMDEEDGSTWLGGLVIDAARQRKGIGRAAVEAFLARFTDEGGIDAALSYSPDNDAARRLYASMGFVETGEMEGDEIVARLRRPSSPD